MSLATLKKRSKHTYRVVSGKSHKEGFAINRASAGNSGLQFVSATRAGGGFSLNGPHRNRGRVGQSMAMSQNSVRHKSIFMPCVNGNPGSVVTAPRGHGGNNNSYIVYLNNHPISNCTTCNPPYLSKPSSMNTKGLLTLKKEKITHNNWVQETDSIQNHTQSNYIDHSVIPHTLKCASKTGCDAKQNNCVGPCKGKRINSRLIYPTNIAKDLHTMTGDEYVKRRKSQDATLPTAKYDSHWPPRVTRDSRAITGGGCSEPESYDEFLAKEKIRKEEAYHQFGCDKNSGTNIKPCNKHNY